jgi:hypothetical protein
MGPACGTLLAIGGQTRTIVSAHTIPGLERPVGLAIKGSEGHIFSADGAITVAPLT